MKNPAPLSLGGFANVTTEQGLYNLVVKFR